MWAKTLKSVIAAAYAAGVKYCRLLFFANRNPEPQPLRPDCLRAGGKRFSVISLIAAIVLAALAVTAQVVTITAPNPTATESGVYPGTFQIARTGSVADALSVTLAYSGTAKMGSDYVTLPQTFVILAGQASVSVTVEPINDPNVELTNAVLTATLQPSAAYGIGTPSAASITIVDNDVFTKTAPFVYSATPDSATAITLRWTDNFETEAKYQVRRNPSGTWVDVPANTTNYQFTGLTPGQAYDFSVRAVAADASLSMSQNALRQVAYDPSGSPAFSTFEQWRMARGLGGALRASSGRTTDDPDGDGRNNLFEYLLGGNPLAPDLAGRSVDITAGSIKLSWPENPDILDAFLAWESSTNLTAWSSAPLTTTFTNGQRSATITPDELSRFFRLTASTVSPPNPSSVITCWGDSLTAYASGYPSRLATALGRTVRNCGIGGDTSIQIRDRMFGLTLTAPSPTIAVNTPAGTPVRIVASRTVHSRIMDPGYRSSWATFAATIANVSKVEFFNLGRKIGESSTPLSTRVTSFIATNNTLLLAAGHPFTNGDVIHFPEGPLPSPLVVGKTYYVRDAAANGFSVTEINAAGLAVVLAANFASAQRALGPFVLDWTHPGGTTALTLRTHTDRDTNTFVFWMGRNNSSRPHEVYADVHAAVEHIKSLNARFLIMGVLTASNEIPSAASGSLPYYYNPINVNALLAREFPNEFIDIRNELMRAGQPTGLDATERANDATPSSLRSDSLHLNDAGYQVVANVLAARIIARGW